MRIDTLLDPVTNFGKVTISAGHSNSDLVIGLNAGNGTKLPNPSTDGAFNMV